MKILLYLSFLGTNYCGYQAQANGISVQQKLNEAAASLFGFECDITGCSRTDSGTHANMFCATVAKKGEPGIDAAIPAEKIPAAFSRHLPYDIAVYAARYVPDGFHARYDVVFKEYIYKIHDASVRDPFLHDRAWHVPRAFNAEKVARMREACTYLIGKKDFSSFMAAGSKITDATRTVLYADVFRAADGTLCFKIAADGFLYNMVRIIAGTLADVAAGKLVPRDMERIITGRDRSLASVTAPATGLYLNKVVY